MQISQINNILKVNDTNRDISFFINFNHCQNSVDDKIHMMKWGHVKCTCLWLVKFDLKTLQRHASKLLHWLRGTCDRCLTRTSRNVINIFEWYVGIHFTSSHIASLSHLHFNFLLWYSWAAKCIASHDISIFSPEISWTVRAFFLSNSTFRYDHKNDKHIQRFYYWLKMNSPRTFISHRLDVSVYRLTKFWQKIYDSDVHHIW